jgi:hypothetical protein
LPFQNSLPAVAELMPCSVRPVPVTFCRPASISRLYAPGSVMPSVVVVAVTFADTSASSSSRLIAVIVTAAARTVPLADRDDVDDRPTRRYCVEATVNVFAAAGDDVSVRDDAVALPEDLRLMFFLRSCASFLESLSRRLTNDPSLPVGRSSRLSVISMPDEWNLMLTMPSW